LKDNKITTENVLHLLLPHFLPIFHFKLYFLLAEAQDYFLAPGPQGTLAMPLPKMDEGIKLFQPCL